MLTLKCIKKFRDSKNRIYEYRLIDNQGNIQNINAKKLKQAIKDNKITVLNLKLSSDNRLVDTAQFQTSTKNKNNIILAEELKIKNLVAKSKLLGLSLVEIPTECKHTCYLISQSYKEHILYIPDNVTKLNLNTEHPTFTEYITDIEGNIKVIGGHNLVDTIAMFWMCDAQSLDLTLLDTSNVTSMMEMFKCCLAKSINLTSFNTSKVKNMSYMFSNCSAESLDLSSFNTSKVENMSSMFLGCSAKSLDLTSFETRKVKKMLWMFSSCKAQYIDLSSFIINESTQIGWMFNYCKPQIEVKTTDKRILKELNTR